MDNLLLVMEWSDARLGLVSISINYIRLSAGDVTTTTTLH